MGITASSRADTTVARRTGAARAVVVAAILDRVMRRERSPRTPKNVAVGVDDVRLVKLRRWNVGLTVLHAAQAVAVVVLASDFAIGVSTSYPQGPPGSRLPQPSTAFDVPIGVAVFAFLALAALDHGLTATALRTRYERDLNRGINVFRWIEYSVSATIMILLIAFYAGITWSRERSRARYRLPQ